MTGSHDLSLFSAINRQTSPTQELAALFRPKRSKGDDMVDFMFQRGDAPRVRSGDAVEVIVYGGVKVPARRYQVLPGTLNHPRLVGMPVGANAGVMVGTENFGCKIVSITHGDETVRRSRRVPALPTGALTH